MLSLSLSLEEEGRGQCSLLHSLEKGRGHGPLLSRRGRQRLRLPPPLPARERKNARARVCHPLSRRLWQRAGLSLRLSQVQRKRARHYPPLFIGRQRTKLLSRKEWQTTRLPPLPSDKERLSASARAIPLRKMKAECRTLSSSLPRKGKRIARLSSPLSWRGRQRTQSLSHQMRKAQGIALSSSLERDGRGRGSLILSPQGRRKRVRLPPLRGKGRQRAGLRQTSDRPKASLNHS